MVWDHKVATSNFPDYGLVEMSRSSREVERANNTNVVSSFLEILFLGFRACVLLMFFCVDTASGESGCQLWDR
jgi:hypothetical protein